MGKSSIALGVIGFILSGIATLYLFGVFSTSNTSVLENIRHIQNFSLDGQLTSMMFWTVLSLLGGFLWVSTLFRSRSVTETVVTALSLSALVISLSVILFYSDIFIQVDNLHSGMLIELVLLSLIAFAFVGFLSRIFREIVSSGVSSIGKK